MRRSLASLAVLAVVVLGVGIAPAAYAAEPLPPPVDPIPALPSTYNRTIATGSGQLFQDQIAYNLYIRQQMAAQRAAAAAPTDAVAVKAAKGVPVTGVRGLATATGGVVTGAFMGGWMITDGTLAMYGHATGNEPMAGTCNQPDWAVATIQVLYPFSAPSCAVSFEVPNEGLVAFSNLTYSGFTASYVGLHVNSSSYNYNQFCYTRSGSIPTGHTLQFTTKGGLTNSQTTLPLSGGAPYQCATGQGQLSAWKDATSSNNLAADPGLRLVQTSTGTVVASISEQSVDPQRTPSCQLTWPGGDVTTVQGNPYKESEGFPVGAVSALCNDGFVSKPGHGPDLLPAEIEIGSTRQDTGEYSEVQTAPVPEFTPDEKKGLTPGTSSGGLVLQRVVGTVVRSCMTWEVSCVGWWPATDNGTDPIVSDGYYRCLFNGSPVSLTECSPYRTTFDTQTANPTITDPNTGTTGPWSSGSPGSQTGTGTFPATGANPGTASSVATGGGGCTAGWSWNPVDWVLNPLRCAFIPSQASISSFQSNVADKWEASVPGSAAASLAGFGSLFAVGNGCGGLPFVLDIGPVHVDTMLFAACEEPMAGIAATVKGLLSFFVIGGALLAIIRYSAGLFGFNPFGIVDPRGEESSGVRFR